LDLYWNTLTMHGPMNVNFNYLFQYIKFLLTILAHFLDTEYNDDKKKRKEISLFFFISNSIHYSLPSTYSICYPLSSTSFRPHRPIIRRSKLYMQPMVFSLSADVFVVRPLRKDSFLNSHTTKTSAEGESTTGCMYNLDLLMMGLWGLKHVEERG